MQGKFPSLSVEIKNPAQAGFLISVVNLIYKNPRLKPGVFYYLAKYFLFPA